MGRLVAAAIPLVLAAWVYHPITASYFFSDDFVWLLAIVNDGLLRMVLRPHGGHDLLARNLVFYGSYQLFGLRADLFFWTVLLTHLLNVWLLFRVLRTLTASLTLACFGAALWGTSPLNAGTLEWYSVFGHALVATCLLVVLDGVTRLAATGRPLRADTACLWYAVLLVGATCFGVGVGIALVFPAALFLLLPQVWRLPRIRLAFLALPVTTGVVYFGLRRLFALLEPMPLREAVASSFSFGRLRHGVPLWGELVAFTLAAVPRSFFFSPAGYPDDAARITWAVLGAGLAVLAWRGDGVSRRTAAAMAILFLGAHLIVGVGRGMAPRPPATLFWMASALRYHYVAAIPIVVLLCMILRELGRFPWLRAVPRGLLLAAALALGVHGFRSSSFRVRDYTWCRLELEQILGTITSEIRERAAAPGSTAYLDNGPLPRFLGPLAIRRDFPGRAAAFVLGAGDDLPDGRSVQFVEQDRAIVAWYAQWPGTPLARLLVPPGAARSPTK